MNLRQRITDFDSTIIAGSMISHVDGVLPILKILKPKTVLEIGTYNGVSAAFFAEHCDFVFTIDIALRKTAFDLWKALGVSDKIGAVQISTNEAKRQVVRRLSFDLAFVDGEHAGPAVKFDFECVKKSKAVLFHDYKPVGGIYSTCTNSRFPDVAEVIDALKPAPILFGKTCSKMALWLNPERISPEEQRDLLASLPL